MIIIDEHFLVHIVLPEFTVPECGILFPWRLNRISSKAGNVLASGPHIAAHSYTFARLRHFQAQLLQPHSQHVHQPLAYCIILHHLALSCVICVNRICRSCWSLAASSVGIRPPGITANSLCDFRGTKGINRVQVWSGMYRLRKYGEIRRVRVQCRVQPGATDDLFVRFCATNSWYLVMLVLPSYTSMYQLAFATTCQLLPLRSFE